MALETLHEEVKPLELQVFWPMTRDQVFGSLLGETIQSKHACGENHCSLESFTYLGSVVHNNGGSCNKSYDIMDSLCSSIWHCQYLCRQTKIQIFKSLVIPVSLYGCETWTLNTDLKIQTDVFGNKCFCRVIEYCWNDFVSN